MECRNWARALAVVVAAGASMARSAHGDAQQTALVAKILLRALGFDRNLSARAKDAVTIAVVYSEQDGTSLASRNEITKALTGMTHSTISGLPLKLVEIAYKNGTDLGAAIDRMNVSVLFVTSGMSQDVPAIRRVAQDRKTRTLASSRGDVESGLSLAVILKEGKPKLLVNLAASQAEGANLDAEMLRLAELIRN
jgi:uncharacterized protein DUF4154